MIFHPRPPFSVIVPPRATTGTATLTGERAQRILRGRPRDRLGTLGSGNGRLRGRPRRLGSTQGGGATWYLNLRDVQRDKLKQRGRNKGVV